jgi:4-hydroxy-tetrahydrodipicolinate synthase
VILSQQAAEFGVAALLVVPPFFFKGVSDEGLYRSFSLLVESCRTHAPRILLYHFPRLSGVPISPDLARRLAHAFPKSIIGVKDSSGDPASARAFVDVEEGFAVFPGTESALPALRDAGISGCISAGANVHGRLLASVWAGLEEGESEEERLALRLRAALDRYPMIPALKALLAERHSDEAHQWRAVRPPLLALDEKQGAQLVSEYGALLHD